MLPQANARLVSIAPPGTSEDWDQPAGPAGAPKWQGNEDAYVMDKIRTGFSTGGGPLTKQKDTRIIVSGNLRDTLGQPLVINTGDIVTYIWRGLTHSRRIMDFAAPFNPNLPMQNFVTLHLNPEPVEVALEGQ